MLNIFLLGTFDVTQGSKSLNGFESNKVRALLAYLSVESNRPHTRDALAALLWPEAPQQNALNSLRNALASLRRTIGDQDACPPYLLVTRESIQLNPASDIYLDFYPLLQPVPGHSALPEFQLRAAAVENYRGPFLQGFSVPDSSAFEEWISLWRERFDLRLLEDLRWLADYHEGCGNFTTSLEYARRMVAVEPWMEEGHCQVMRLLALSGQRTQALHQHQILTDVLQRELAAEPGETATRLYQDILSGQFSSSPAQPHPIHNLPVQLNRFIGRERESESLKQLLLSLPNRLVTVTGAGGSGKSRLALETAWSNLEYFPDGIFFVEINAQMTLDTLWAAISNRVGLDFYPVPASPQVEASLQDRLWNYLKTRRVLLVLDSFETIMDAAGEILSLLRATQTLKILITSRVRLNIEGETVFPLNGLAFPTEPEDVKPNNCYEAVDLFAQFAHQSNPDFVLNEKNQSAVEAICRQVQGMPLGILLAAGWMGMLEPAQIQAEIHRSLDFLSASWGSLPERQRSLRATFEYSWKLLSETQQLDLMRLSLFPASFSAARALQICGVTLPALKSLLDQSLLQRGGVNGYRLHDLLRQYSLEKLDAHSEELRSMQDKYIKIYLDLLVDWSLRIKTSQQIQVLEEMSLEQDAIRLAWHWTVEFRGANFRIDALDGLCRYYLILSRVSEGLMICAQSLDHLERQGIAPANPIYCALKRWETIYRWNLGQGDKAYQLINSQVQFLRNLSGNWNLWRQEMAYGLVLLGQFHPQNLSFQTVELMDQGLELFRSFGDKWGIAYALTNLTEIHDRLGNRKECSDSALEAIEILGPDGDPYLLTRSKMSLSYCYMMAGDGDLADQLVAELVPYFMKVGEPYSLAKAYSMLVYAHWYMGRYAEARAAMSHCYESLGIRDIFHRSGGLRPTANLFLLDGVISLLDGNYTGLIAHFTQLSTESEYFNPLCLAIIGLLLILEGNILQALPYLELAWHKYEHMPRKDHMGWPLSFLCLAQFERREYVDARSTLISGLEYTIHYPVITEYCLCLGDMALILAEKGDLDQAIELYQTVIAHPWAKNSKLFYDLYQTRIEKLAEQSGEKTNIQPAQEWRKMHHLAEHYLTELHLHPDFCEPRKRKQGDAVPLTAPPC